MAKAVLYVGDLWYGSTALWRMNSLRKMGFEIDELDSTKKLTFVALKIYNLFHKLKIGIDFNRINQRLGEAAKNRKYDLIWIDKGLLIYPVVLKTIRKNSPSTFIVAFSPDDMFNPINQTYNYLATIKLYDLIITTKAHNVEQYQDREAKCVRLVQKTYDPEIHKPMELTAEEQVRMQSDIGFIGNFEEPRYQSMLFLAHNGVRVKVRGEVWKKYSGVSENLMVDPFNYFGSDYAKIICATKINLGFLHKGNKDKQTARSIEIPACRGFLLAERTNEHLSLFKEGIEAEFFSGDDELLQKVSYYLANEPERLRIANAGYNRCIQGKYDNYHVLRRILEEQGLI